MNDFFYNIDINSPISRNIIDIRDSYYYNLGHIENAINIPYNELYINYNKYLKKDNKYYIYCQSGIKSKIICKILSIQGYNVVNMLGGFVSYKG